MTDLIVTPIDQSKPGSYRERKQFMRLLKRLNVSRDKRDPDAVLDIFDEVDTLLLKRLKTSDGSPVEDALDALSANQFDQLLGAVVLAGGAGEATAVSSTSGPGDTATNTPTG